MSGIVGIYNLDGRPVQQDDIQRMLDSIAHRGPDGSDIWTSGSVGLGHRMLWTTPESLHEKLPFTNKSGDLTITADARIDNRDELIPTLNLNGRPRETIPDSEIILAAYEKWGEKCPEKLLGDFSFAIHDKRKQIIYCARDPIGIKPFYYYFREGKFRWSSEPKAIFEDKTIPKEPNVSLICLYLLNRFDEREETLYKNIYRLPPSHFIVLENGQVRKGQYWDIDPNYSIRYKTDQEYAERFLELFKEAIRVRLRSHGPVGALLSGGLDSSSIVCTAQLLYREKSIPKNEFETFSIIFDTFPCDERIYIHEIVNKYNIHANYFKHEDHLPSVDFEQIQNFPDVGYFPTLLFWGPICADARQKGIRVMFDGIGGDDILEGGYSYLTDLFTQMKIRKLIAQLWHDSSLSSLYSPFSLFLEYCLKPVIPKPIKVPLKKLISLFWGNGIPPWFNKALFNKTGLNQRLYKERVTPYFPMRTQQHIYNHLRYGWNFNIALDSDERFEAYFSIESRHPFLDRRLIEFCLAVPEEQRWSTDWPTKKLLRNAMQNVLPESIRKRDEKADFTSIVDWELKKRQADKLDEILKFSTVSYLGITDKERFYELLNRYREGATLNYRQLNVFEVMVWLELWVRSAIKLSTIGGGEKNG
jgi:asparagine synthase (glutamine-hydrolysing)